MKPTIKIIKAISAAALLALAVGNASADTVTRVNPEDLHISSLRPTTSTYLVYFHGVADTGIKRAMLATSRVSHDDSGGQDNWVIDQHWESEGGVVHTAHTVHSGQDIATLTQTSAWLTPDRNITTYIEPGKATGHVQGELPEASLATMRAGFASMNQGWWMNWHSDLPLLPLLPFEKGGTLRIRMFDVGMAAPIDVDYTVLGDRNLTGADGLSHACWLVETESGKPGSNSFQRFWIEKTTRVILKEEDASARGYRTKLLLAAPTAIEFPLPPPAGT